MIIGNITAQHRSPIRFSGGATLNERANTGGTRRLNRFYSTAEWSRLSSDPSGYVHPYTAILPMTAGGMASFNLLLGDGETTTSNLAGGFNLSTDTNTVAGAGDITTASGYMLYYASAALSGLSDASIDITALGELEAQADGAATVTPTVFAVAEATAQLDGVASDTFNITAPGSVTVTIAGLSDTSGDIDAVGVISVALAGVATVTGNANAALSAQSTITASGVVTANAAAVLETSATLSGSSDTTMDLLASLALEATIDGTGVVSDAAANMAANLQLTLTGSSTTAADIIGAWSMVTTLPGTSSCTVDGFGDAFMVLTLSGTGACAVDARADAYMEATVAVAISNDPLSPENLAAAVWNASEAAQMFTELDNLTTVVESTQLTVDEIKVLVEALDGGGGGGTLPPEVLTELETLTRLLQQNIRVLQANSCR